MKDSYLIFSTMGLSRNVSNYLYGCFLWTLRGTVHSLLHSLTIRKLQSKDQFLNREAKQRLRTTLFLL